jgi:hypothetical protein
VTPFPESCPKHLCRLSYVARAVPGRLKREWFQREICKEQFRSMNTLGADSWSRQATEFCVLERRCSRSRIDFTETHR